MAKYLIVGTDLRRERLYREGEVIELDPAEAARKTCLVPVGDVFPGVGAPETVDAQEALDSVIDGLLEDVMVPDPDLEGIFADVVEAVEEGVTEIRPALPEILAPAPETSAVETRPQANRQPLNQKKTKAPKRRGKKR